MDREALIQEMMRHGHTRSTAEAAIAGRGSEGLSYYWNEYMGGNSKSVDPNVAIEQLKQELATVISEIDEKLSAIPLALTDEELDTFLQKAIEQVKPYYEKKRAEIEKSIETGKIRSAEDVLAIIRKVRDEATALLSKYDIEKAETEEQLADTLAEITSRTKEELDFKKNDFKTRIDNAKQGLVQKQTLTSGIGQKELKDIRERQAMEEAEITRAAGYQTGEAERKAKFDLQTIALARKSVEDERLRQLGTPEQEAATTASALQTAGLGNLGALPSEEQMALSRAQNPYTAYKPEALTDLTEEQKRAVESRKLELQAEELAIRQANYEAQKKKILAEQVKEHANLSDYIYGSYSAAI